jgi:hypothetical protein
MRSYLHVDAPAVSNRRPTLECWRPWAGWKRQGTGGLDRFPSAGRLLRWLDYTEQSNLRLGAPRGSGT